MNEGNILSSLLVTCGSLGASGGTIFENSSHHRYARRTAKEGSKKTHGSASDVPLLD